MPLFGIVLRRGDSVEGEITRAPWPSGHSHLWFHITCNLNSITCRATLQIKLGPINYQSMGSG